MPLPGNLSIRTVTGTYIDLTGAPVVGQVTFAIDPVLTDVGAAVVIMPKTITAVLNGSGQFSISLPVTDDTDIAPTGFAYKVTEQFDGVKGRTYYMSVPTGVGAIDISAVAGGSTPPVINPTYVTSTELASEQSARIAGDNFVRYYVNVKDPAYGALGNNSSDDRAAIQAAIDAVHAAGGGTVFIPAGTYLLGATLNIPAGDGLQIIGSGWNTYLKLKNAANCYALTFPAADTRVAIRDLTIDGNHSAQTGTSGGIYAAGAVACQFEHIHFIACRDNALYLGPQTGGAFGHNNRVVGCLFDQAMTSTGPGRGIHCDSSDENQIMFCDFEYLGGSGGSGATTASMILDQAGTQFIANCNFVNGANNVIGVRVQDAKSTKIIGCNFDGTAGTGIFLAAQRCIVQGNTIFSPGHSGAAGQASGIHLEYAATDNIVTENVITSDPTNGVSRGAIREVSDGNAGGNNISDNIIVTTGAWSYGALDLSGKGSQVLSNIGGGIAGDRGIFVNVKSPLFKAIGDGTTDDTAAIQAAITASNGGTVFLPPGTYLLNGSVGLSLAATGAVLRGAGQETTKIQIGAGFTAASAISISGNNCCIIDLTITGTSTTTTSNPVANAITATGVRRTRIDSVMFWYINGWSIKMAADGTASGNPDGTMLTRLIMRQCAGGIYFLGNTAQGFAVNSFISNVHMIQGGVATGASANLDNIRVEDAWDVLIENALVWMRDGTGSCLHIVGNCAAAFVMNLDTLGPNTLQTSPSVLIEDGANGSPQNIQITGGVIQQGLVGLRVSGAASQVHVSTSRIMNNKTHGVQVDGTGANITFRNCFFTLNGSGATGTNYEVNWSGTATGFMSECRFGTSVTTSGVAGVQTSLNFGTAGQAVRLHDVAFGGSGASSSNWYTNKPSAAMHASAGVFEFLTSINFLMGAGDRVALQPSSSGNSVMSTNVAGNETFDRWRLLGTGAQQYGTGTAARDATWQRIGTAQMGTPDSDIVVGLAGKTVFVKEGTNAKMGTATLNGTTAVTVSTTAVTANSRIYLGYVTPAGTPSAPYVSAKTVGTSFAVKAGAGDTSLIAWWIVEAA